MKTKRTVIGPRSVVSFPEQKILDVPVKIDTGADSSSIWASNIAENNGVLTFSLFGPGSPWYTGETVSTKDYRLLSVKNSFGTSEVRYKVPLKIELNGRKIKARFTLSNRERNRYPILIGRQTLKNKFVVDVSIEHPAQDHIRVLVLCNSASKQITSQMNKLAENYKQDLEVEVAKYKDIVITTSTDEVRVSIGSKSKDLVGYDMVYFLTRVKNAEIAAIIASYLKRNGVMFVDSAAVLLSTDTKSHQSALLAGHGISMPKSIFMSSDAWELQLDFVIKELGLPLIFKDDRGTKGRNNYLIKSKKEFAQIINQPSIKGLQMIAQQYIESDGYFRVVVMGKTVAAAIFRKINSKVSHVYNKTRDEKPELVNPKELPVEVQRLAINAAQQLMIEVAGVDILQDKKTGVWYCLEVNNSPQIVGGAFVDQKLDALAKFFITEASK